MSGGRLFLRRAVSLRLHNAACSVCRPRFPEILGLPPTSSTAETYRDWPIEKGVRVTPFDATAGATGTALGVGPEATFAGLVSTSSLA